MSESDEQERLNVNGKIDKTRWRVRRRFAIIAFAELVASPFWIIPLVRATSEEFAKGIFGTLVLALMGVIGAYIGGVVLDDNLQRKSKL